MAVPYTFGTATASIPLSNLDSNFATTITLGNTAIQLGNTVTTLNNMTLANVTVSSGNLTLTNVSATLANVTTANIGTAVITGTSTLTGLTASTALALDASKNIVSVTNTGSGNNVLGTSPTIATPTINTITSAASTALVLQSNNGNTAVTFDTSQNATFAGTLATSSKGIAKASMPAGTVLQVVNATTTTQTTSTSTSYSDTSLSASITPTSSTSKILVICSFVLYPANAGGAAAVVGLNRGATLIFDQAGYNNVGSSQITSAFNYLDSPSTTSSTTYTCRLKSSIALSLVAFGLTGYSNVITLMEISA